MIVKILKILLGTCSFIFLTWLVITTDVPHAPTAQPCTQAWFLYLGVHYFDMSDGEGHGPDLGSNEWFNMFERKAKLAVMSSRPEQRCQRIQGQLERRTYIINEQIGVVISL